MTWQSIADGLTLQGYAWALACGTAGLLYAIYWLSLQLHRPLKQFGHWLIFRIRCWLVRRELRAIQRPYLETGDGLTDLQLRRGSACSTAQLGNTAANRRDAAAVTRGTAPRDPFAAVGYPAPAPSVCGENRLVGYPAPTDRLDRLALEAAATFKNRRID